MGTSSFLRWVRECENWRRRFDFGSHGLGKNRRVRHSLSGEMGRRTRREALSGEISSRISTPVSKRIVDSIHVRRDNWAVRGLRERAGATRSQQQGILQSPYLLRVKADAPRHRGNLSPNGWINE
jgi:hypothetical protein